MSSGHSGTNSADRKNIETGMEGIENGPVSSTSRLSKQKEDTVVEQLQIEGMVTVIAMLIVRYDLQCCSAQACVVHVQHVVVLVVTVVLVGIVSV